MSDQDFHFFDELGSQAGHFQPEKVLDLRSENEDGNAGGKTHRYQIGNVFDDCPQPRQARHQQNHSRHDGAYGKILGAVFGVDPVEDDDERPGRPTDTHLRATERRDEEARDDGRKDTSLWWRARCNRERHRQGQRHNTNGNTSDKIRRKILAGVILERVEQFRSESEGHVHFARSSVINVTNRIKGQNLCARRFGR